MSASPEIPTSREALARHTTSPLEVERLISKYVRPGKEHPLSGATIGRSGPSVCRIIRLLQASSGDLNQVRKYFGISEPALEATLEYYDRYRSFIDAKILLDADVPETKK